MNNKILFFLVSGSFVLCSNLSASELSLSQAFSAALAQNHGYKSKIYESSSLQQASEQRNAKLFPQVNLALNGGLHDYIENFGTNKRISEFYKSYSLSMTQQLYHPEYFTAVEQSKNRILGGQEELSKTEQELGLNVAKAFIDLAVAQQNLQISKENYDFYALKHTQAEEMLKMGLSTKIDLLDTQLYRDRAHIDINTADKKVYLAQKKLESLILEPIGSVPRLTQNIEALSDFMLHDRDVSTELNPDLKIARISRFISEQEVDLRSADQYPKVDLSLSRSENDTNDRAMYKTDNRAYVQVSIPLYQGGYAVARVEEAKLLSYAAAEKETQTRIDVNYRIEELKNDLSVSIENMRILEQAKQYATANLSSIEIAKKAGLKSQIDLLEARSRLYKTEQDALKQLSDTLSSYLTLKNMGALLKPAELENLENILFDKSSSTFQAFL